MRGEKSPAANPKTIMTKLTPEILKAAGFEPIDRDKLTIKYQLVTKWQTVTIWQYTPARNSYTMVWIAHPGDRVQVLDTEQLYQTAMILGADSEVLGNLEKIR